MKTCWFCESQNDLRDFKDRVTKGLPEPKICQGCYVLYLNGEMDALWKLVGDRMRRRVA